MTHDPHVIGPAAAPLMLVEYGDYECPACGRAYLVMQVVRAELGDALRFRFRNFPLPQHAHAMAAAEAAESVAAHAGDRAFWAMYRMLYENQDALEVDDLLGYADAAGANPERVAADLSTGAMRGRVEHDRRSGIEAGVAGTPAFFLNGRRFTGDWSDADAFTEALQAAVRENSLH